MIIYLSGGANIPETVCKRSSLMLSFINNCKRGKPGSRYRGLMELRREFPNRHKHFLDSGAFTLFAENVVAKRTDPGLPDNFSYYRTDKFWEEVDKYAKFVKKYGAGCDHYANMDVIHHPQLTWRVQQYLEDHHKLDPIPVVHFGTPLKWLKRYLKHGYDYIALGGMGQGATVQTYIEWVTPMFKYLCPNSGGRFPIVKVHGFAVTAYDLLIKYPWWSVDSASWTQSAGYGNIYVPHRRNGKWDFSVKPYTLPISDDVSERSNKKSANRAKLYHHSNFAPELRKIVQKWLDKIELPLGSVDQWGDRMKWGVVSAFRARAIANVKFFQHLEKALPEWPWRFKDDRVRACFDL